MTDTVTAQEIANEFVGVLAAWLTVDEWREMQRRNATESNPNICHSHDFCDANEAMGEVFARHGIDWASDEGTALWNAAWQLAMPQLTAQY